MQGDLKFLYVLEKLGCRLKDANDALEVDATGIINYCGLDIDMSDFSDQALTMAVVCHNTNTHTKHRTHKSTGIRQSCSNHKRNNKTGM